MNNLTHELNYNYIYKIFDLGVKQNESIID